jgi:hypothetical protein
MKKRGAAVLAAFLAPTPPSAVRRFYIACPKAVHGDFWKTSRPRSKAARISVLR